MLVALSRYMGIKIFTFSPLLSLIDFISPGNLGCGFSVESIINLDFENWLIFSRSPLLSYIFAMSSGSYRSI